MGLSRRTFILGIPALAGATSLLPTTGFAQPFGGRSTYESIYGPIGNDLYPVPGVNLTRINPAYLRKLVPYDTPEAPGTIVIDTGARYLYHVQDGGLAMRYGVGVGRTGFSWSGTAMIGDKQEWPDWYPPKEMFSRQPELMDQMGELPGGPGMAGGPGNPLGARALYLFQGKKDTLYRIHGTFEPWTIGTNVSSGCIRMINQDAMDLYDRTPIGTRVVVLPSGRSRRAPVASRT